MCNPFQEVSDFIDDAVDFTVDLVGDVISWLIPQPDIPDFSEQFAEQQSKGILPICDATIGKFASQLK